MAAKPKREDLVEELLKLRAKYAPYEGRDKEICALLKEDAGGENYQVTIDKLGRVKVSAPKPERTEGTAPEIVVEAYLKLPEAQAAKLRDKGLVRIVEITKAKYYGSVTVELFG